jgi:hypothetical protein
MFIKEYVMIGNDVPAVNIMGYLKNKLYLLTCSCFSVSTRFFFVSYGEWGNSSLRSGTAFDVKAFRC